MLQSQDKFSKFLHDNYGAVVTRFKIMGKLDIAERRLPQDGAIPLKLKERLLIFDFLFCQQLPMKE